MANLTAAQVAEKWQRNMAGSRQSYVDGINGVTESPAAMAAAAVDRWETAMREVIDNGLWVNAMEAAPGLQEWKRRCVDIGAARLTSGATTARPKVQRFFEEFLPVLRRNVEQVRDMPNATFEQRLERMTEMARLNHQFRVGGGGGGGAGRIGGARPGG